MPSVVITADAELADQARRLAERLHLPLVASDLASARFVLHLSASGLSLRDTATPDFSPLQVDFTSGKTAYRRGQSEMLVKAMGRHRPLRVLDALAGLGRDAFVLASAGFEVSLLEQHPVIHALLEEGLAHGRAHPSTHAICHTMQLLAPGNALDYLPALRGSSAYDVIYLDPMYPQRAKSAAVKKDLRLLQQLLGAHSASSGLLDAALQVAQRRVVVKRPLKGQPLEHRTPSYVVKGRSTRFDVYLTGC